VAFIVLLVVVSKASGEDKFFGNEAEINRYTMSTQKLTYLRPLAAPPSGIERTLQIGNKRTLVTQPLTFIAGTVSRPVLDI
jgi:hypothetical protein